VTPPIVVPGFDVTEATKSGDGELFRFEGLGRRMHDDFE
jgi:hypothetical protein